MEEKKRQQGIRATKNTELHQKVGRDKSEIASSSLNSAVNTHDKFLKNINNIGKIIRFYIMDLLGSLSLQALYLTETRQSIINLFVPTNRRCSGRRVL